MIVTELGIMILVIPVHPLKASDPILDTVLSIVTEINWVYEFKAL